MNVGNLFNQAVNISSAFLRILQEDADLDSSYSLNIAQIEQRYKSKISEFGGINNGTGKNILSAGLRH